MANAGDPILLETMPGYEAGRDIQTSDSLTFTTVETVIGSVTFSAVDGVVYRVSAVARVNSSVAGDTIVVALREDDESGTRFAQVNANTVDLTNQDAIGVAVMGYFTASSTASKTLALTALRLNGSGNVARRVVSTAPQVMSVVVAG